MSLNKVAKLVSFSCRSFRALNTLIWRIAKGVQYSLIPKLSGPQNTCVVEEFTELMFLRIYLGNY